MTKREVVQEAMAFRRPPYVPWSVGFMSVVRERLEQFLGTQTLEEFCDPHLFMCPGASVPPRQGGRDRFGTKHARAENQDMGPPVDVPIKRPEDLASYEWPEPFRAEWCGGPKQWFTDLSGRYRVLMSGASLFERAWGMRGMEDLLADIAGRPEFVEELLDAITEFHLTDLATVLREVPSEAVWFGDDYGMQTGLTMGMPHWRRLIKPRLARLFAMVRDEGRLVFIHSCGKVDGILDDLIEIGLNIFNPFQPEVMDVVGVFDHCRGRLAFAGGLGVQSVLPHGTPQDVREATERLIELGNNGGLIVGPSHSVTLDVPLENVLAMMEVLKAQPGYA